MVNTDLNTGDNVINRLMQQKKIKNATKRSKARKKLISSKFSTNT
jgi:RecA-family ATPase